MTRASEFLTSVLGADDYNKLTEENAPGLPTPGEAKDDNKPQMQIDNMDQIATSLDNLVNSMDELPGPLADLIETYLGPVDPSGYSSVYDTVHILPLEQAQDLYEQVASWCENNDIDFDEVAETTQDKDATAAPLSGMGAVQATLGNMNPGR